VGSSAATVTCVRTLLRIQEKPVLELQGQQSRDLGGVVPVPFEVMGDHGLQGFSVDVGPGKGAGIKQNLLHIPGEDITIPESEVAELVPPEE